MTAVVLASLGVVTVASAAESEPLVTDAKATIAEPTGQMNATLSGQRYSFETVAPGGSTDGLAESLSCELINFFAPLKDDGAPYTLEPFLQRAGSWSLSVGGGHFSTRNPFGGESRTSWSGGVSAAVNAYLKRWLAVTGGLGYGYSLLHDVGLAQSTHSLSGSAGVGLRVANTRIDGWYGLEALDVEGEPSALRQRVGVTAFTAIARRFTLDLAGSLEPSGADASASLEYYATREVGIFGGGSVAKGKLYSDDVVPTRKAAWVGLAAWLDPTVGIVGTYQLTIEDLPERGIGDNATGYHELSHTVSFELYSRFDEL